MSPLVWSAVARRAALASHLSLCVAMALTLSPVIATLLIVPLLLPLAGLWRGVVRTYGVTSLLLTFYVGGWLAAGYAEPQAKWSHFGVATLAMLDFSAVVLFARFRAREQQAARPTAQTATSNDVVP